MVTPDEIENRVFSLVRRGYDPAEVDDFLREVATTLAQAQGGLQTPPAAEAPAAEPPPAVTVDGPDDFGQLGEEIAKILRQAHESVAELRHRAEAEAALIRENAKREADGLKAEADRDRQAAAVDVEAAQAEVARITAEIKAQSDRAAEAAAANALARAAEVVESAKGGARGAVTVQRNVRRRLEEARNDIDAALDDLLEEDEDLFATIDLSDTTVAEAGGPLVADQGDVDATADLDVPPPGQGPPTPPVAPPPRTTPSALQDLPYASDEDEVDIAEDAYGDDDEVIDLTDAAAERAEAANPVPNPPAPVDDPRADVLVPDGPESEHDEGDEDALAQMVKNAVENALRRRKGDDTPNGNGGNGS